MGLEGRIDRKMGKVILGIIVAIVGCFLFYKGFEIIGAIIAVAGACIGGSLLLGIIGAVIAYVIKILFSDDSF